MSFCKGCGARVEWHPHRDGRTVAIDPEPVVDGPLAFGPGLKLGPASFASKRRYRYHLPTCANPEKAMEKRATVASGRECFKCGEDGHWAAECPEAS